MDGQSVTNEGKESKCDICLEEHPDNEQCGVGLVTGDSRKLTHNIVEKMGTPFKYHPLRYTIKVKMTAEKDKWVKGKKKREAGESYDNWIGSIAAHHLIVGSVFDNADDDEKEKRNTTRQKKNKTKSNAPKEESWAETAIKHGYNINHHNNGVFLPAIMEYACHLGLPLHMGNHDQGECYNDMGESFAKYPTAVHDEVKDIIKLTREQKVCEQSDFFIQKMNEFSEEILKHISNFKWLLTSDGKDYKIGGKGCGGATKLSEPKTCHCRQMNNPPHQGKLAKEIKLKKVPKKQTQKSLPVPFSYVLKISQ